MIQCSSVWTLVLCPMSPYPRQPGFLTLCPVDIWGQVMLCWGRGGCILCIEGYLAAPLVSTHQMPAVTPSPVATIPNHCQMSPGRQNHLRLRTTDVKQSSRNYEVCSPETELDIYKPAEDAGQQRVVSCTTCQEKGCTT